MIGVFQRPQPRHAHVLLHVDIHAVHGALPDRFLPQHLINIGDLPVSLFHDGVIELIAQSRTVAKSHDFPVDARHDAGQMQPVKVRHLQRNHPGFPLQGVRVVGFLVLCQPFFLKGQETVYILQPDAGDRRPLPIRAPEGVHLPPPFHQRVAGKGGHHPRRIHILRQITILRAVKPSWKGPFQRRGSSRCER